MAPRSVGGLDTQQIVRIKELPGKPNSLTFRVTDEDAERLKVLRQLIVRLPDLIQTSRRKRLQTKLEQYVELMTDTTPLERVHLEIEQDNVRLREDFVKDSACLTSAEVHECSSGTSRNRAQTAARWKARHKIFSVPYAGQQLFPAFQFRDGKPLRVVGEVLEHFGDRVSPWQTALWFVSANGWLDDATPVSLLIEDPERVVEAAKREVEHAVL